MKIKWKCNCGFIGESEVGYWMRCDNPNCPSKNAFKVLSVEGFGDVPDFEKKLINIEKRITQLEKATEKKRNTQNQN